MSAFGFIIHKTTTRSSNSSSPPLSLSLIEDLYDSQQATFVNQSRPRSKKPSSYFSFIDDLPDKPSTTSSSQSSHSGNSTPRIKNKKSAFSFISQSATTLQPDNVSSSSQAVQNSQSVWTPTTPSRIKPDKEMKLISIQSSFHRLQTEKSNQHNGLDRLYTKQLQIIDQISTLKSKIHLVQQQKDTALTTEDFLVAETLQTQEQKMNQSLVELEHTQQSLQDQIHASWHRLQDIVTKEREMAIQLGQVTEQVKQERYVQYMKFVTDKDRIYQEKLQAIGNQRAVIASEKSEVAFDLGLWEQSDEDLQERQEDTVHEEMAKKKELQAQSELVQSEMDELKSKLKALELEKASFEKSIQELESIMTKKLGIFKTERQDHEQELKQIESRGKEIEYKALQLDGQETHVDSERTHHEKEKERGLKELEALDDQIALAHEKSTTTVYAFLQELEYRDRLVTQHKSELQKNRKTIQDKKQNLKDTIYTKQQEEIQLDENILEMNQKLKSLGRKKQLAIEAGRFQNAAAWTNQIKELNQLMKQKQQKVEDGEEVQLIKEKEALTQLEQDYVDLEKEKNAEIKLILEKSKQNLLLLQEQKDDSMMIQKHELKLIQVQLDEIYQQQQDVFTQVILN